MKCPDCGYENRPEADFCGGCGQSFVAEKTCPKCRHVNPHSGRFCDKCGRSLIEPAPEEPPPARPSTPQPTSFPNRRYMVKKLLGEGGKKTVYLTYDILLDRDVAFALIKTGKLDDASRMRVTREAKAMGKLGDHPNIVIPFMPGGDVAGMIEIAYGTLLMKEIGGHADETHE